MIAKGELIDIIPQIIAKEYPQSAQEIDFLIKEKLAKGKCLLLLNALDEVPKEKREKLKEKLQGFTRQYPNKIYLTSRIVGYGGNFLGDTKEVEIVPFSQPQIEQYIKTWFVNAAEYLTDNSVSARGLIEELRQKPQINGLAQNPLLLSLICSLYQEKELVLPARRSQLYETAVDLMLNQWRRNRDETINPWKVKAKIKFLEKLAYDFSCEGKQVFSEDDLYEKAEAFLKGEEIPSLLKNSNTEKLLLELTEEDGIIQKFHEEGKQYLFLHRTFQEYFTACYLQQKIQRDFQAGLELVKAHWWDYNWHETISLLGGLLDNPLPLIEAIMQKKDDIFWTQLLLAGRCLAECGERQDKLSEKIIERIYQLWRSHLKYDFLESSVVALGRSSSAMVKKLKTALRDKDGRWVRRELAEALGQIGTSEAIIALINALQDSDDDVRKAATEALVKNNTPRCCPRGLFI
jgi:hypothetical protein